MTARPSALKSRALIALALTWLLVGIGGAYLLSSAGPIFYDTVLGGDTFRGLTLALEEGAPVTAKTADLLHANGIATKAPPDEAWLQANNPF